MTIDEAKKEFPNIESFKCQSCISCKHDCNYRDCQTLEKAERVGMERIQQAFVRHDGDIYKVWQFINRAKV